MTRQRELFLPFKHPPGTCPAVTHARSTLLAASLQTVKQLGWEARYFAQLPPHLHDDMRMMTAGSWVPIAFAFEHYGACDRMQLSREEKERIGVEVSLRTQKTFAGTLGAMAAGAGATPWNLFAVTPRIWARMFDGGGDNCVYKVGPKDAIAVITACPLLRLDYFRHALRSYYAAVANLVSTTVHSREVSEFRAESQIGIRFSWA